MSLLEDKAHAAAQLRNARLLLDNDGDTPARQPLISPAVRRALKVGRVPSLPWRVVQQLRYKRGMLDFERTVTKPYMAARREFSGDEASGPPKFLIRVDEFPNARAVDEPQEFGTARFERFHEIMRNGDAPYLVAVLPRVSREPLSPEGTDSRSLDDGELRTLLRIADEQVCFGLHGRDHRTRYALPRRHSELCGLSLNQTDELLDQALAELSAHEIRTDVFVPPFNRFDSRQWPSLASRFDVVCGGPESIGLLGFQRSPQWREDAVYLPSYAPFYGRAHEILPAAERAIERQTGLWTPIVLHWGWEADAGWSDLERLVAVIGPYAAQWEDFLAAVRHSR